MPRIKQELQISSKSNVTRPLDGVSLYNDNGSIKILHADGTVETLITRDDQSFAINNSNYYTKSQIDSLIRNAGVGFRVKIYSDGIKPASPAQEDEGSLFLVAKPNGGYEEWLYVDNTWERVGEDDLSNYATQTQVSQKSSVTFIDWTK